MPYHVLSVETPDILNTCVIRIIDTSLYDPNIPADCITLQVTVPGFVDPSVLTGLSENYTLNLSACDLGIQTTNCDNYTNDLSDGVYIIRHSLSPNDKVFIEYNHLRTTAALNKYYKILCCIQKSFDCDPAPEVRKKITQMGFLKTLLDAAKAEVEFCHTPKHGMASYRYVMSQFDKLARGCGCQNC